MTPKEREQQLQQLINKTVLRCHNELNRSIGQAATLISGNDNQLPTNGISKKVYDKIFTDLNNRVELAIKNGIISADDLANGHIDKVVLDYIGDKKNEKAFKAKMFNIVI